MKTRLDIIDPGDICSEIIRKRNERNMTQIDLANSIKSSNSVISSIENNKRNATIPQLEKIFNSMGYRMQIALTQIK